jgi:DNA-binding PadR family transcriptional regulator
MAGKDKATAFLITSADERLLTTIAAYHYLTADQVMRLWYSPTVITYVRERLKRLADADYLQRTYATRAVPVGRSKTVYRLGPKGIAYLQSADMIGEERYRPSEHRFHGELYLAHTLAINDVLIAAALVDRLVPEISLAGFRHDLDLRRAAERVEITQGSRRELLTVIPDGWLDFHLQVDGRSERSPILLEVDRGTKAVRDFKRKLRALLAYITGGTYQRVFGTKFVTVLFAVDVDAFTHPQQPERRVADILRWATEELKELKREKYGDLIVVGTLRRPPDLEPLDFFLSPRWSIPSQGLPVSLLDLPDPVPLVGTAGRSDPASATR